MATVEELQLLIKAEARQAVREIRNFKKAQNETLTVLQSFDKQLTKWVSGMFSAAAAPIAVGVALKKLVDIGADMVRAYSESEVASAKLSAVLRATGNSAGLTAGQLGTMAGELQELTGVEDDAVTGLQATMLTFRNVTGETFGRAIKTAIDMGQIFGSVESATLQLGKALNDPVQGISALQRVGVTFSQEQKNLIASLVETGRVAEAQDVILSELEHQVGGVAQAMASTASGSLQKLNNALGDMKERGGEAILTFAKPFIDWLERTVTKSNEAAASAKNLKAVLTADSAEALKAADPGAAIKEIDRQIAAEKKKLEVLVANKDMMMAYNHWREKDFTNAVRQYKDRIEGLERERRAIDLKSAGLRLLMQLEEEAREKEEEAAAAAEEKARRDTVAEAYRLQAAREYSMKLVELEGDALEVIEAKRQAALEEAARSYVETGEEIELINRYFDELRQNELERREAAAEEVESVTLLQKLAAEYNASLARQAELKIAIAEISAELAAEEAAPNYDKTRIEYLSGLLSLLREQAGIEDEAADAEAERLSIADQLWSEHQARLKETNELTLALGEAQAARAAAESAGNTAEVKKQETIIELLKEKIGLEKEAADAAKSAYDVQVEQLKGLQEQMQQWDPVFDSIKSFYSEWNALADSAAEAEIRRMEDALDRDRDAFSEELELRRSNLDGSVEAEEEFNRWKEEQELLRYEKEQEIEAKKNELKRKQFEQNKKMSVANAVISGGVAAAKAFELGPIAGPIAAALIAGLTAAQIAMIKSQQYPGLAEGGIVPAQGDEGGLYRLGDKNRPEAVIPLDRSELFRGDTIAVHFDGTYHLYGAGGLREFSERVTPEIVRVYNKGRATRSMLAFSTI